MYIFDIWREHTMTFLRVKKLVTGVLCFALFMSIVPLNASETVCADTFISFDDDNPVAHNEFRSVEDYEYNAEANALAQWPGHSNIEITFTNTGDETIHDWYFTFDFNYEIENPYNCYIVEHDGNLYTIGNNDWNQDILPGQTVTIGFTASSDDGSDIEEEPTFFLLNTKTISLQDSDLSWSFEQYSDWTTGFSGALILTNNSEEQIRDWAITFDSNRPITQVDAAVLSSNDGNTYSITNDGNNQNITAGQSYRIELQGGEHDPLEALVLTNYTVTSRAVAYTLDEDNNGNGVADVREIDFGGIVTVVPTATLTPVPTATSTPVVTNTPSPTTVPTINPTSTSTPTPIVTVTPTASVTPIPTAVPTGIPDEIDYEKDSDSDGLSDYFEEYLGTDINNPDTDSDGVSDYYEIMLSTDPLDPHSNGNSDYDLDGINNAQELELGTNPKNPDSDFDGLSDYDEIYILGTDPKSYDTDDDGMNDYNEIQLGSNAVSPDSEIKRYQSLEFEPSGDLTLTGVIKVTVSGYISGAMSENTTIIDIYQKDLQTSSIEALVGDPVNIETSGEFDSMRITFKYSDNLNENNLRIMWFDEENCEYVVLKNYTINKSSNTISVTTNHFSKYMLIDEGVWVESWAASMSTTSNTSALARSYSLSGYKYDMGRLQDSDSDGLPDSFEKNGMITNTGNIIYTDPNDPDTDNDGLLDGYEMGELCLTETIFDRSPFWNYISAWYAGYGYRCDEYVYYKMISNPTMFSTDIDCEGDGEDKNPLTPKQDIIYILYQDDDGLNEHDSQLFCDTYKKQGLNCKLVGFNGSTDFIEKWNDIGKRMTNSNALSADDDYYNVTDVVIVAHGIEDQLLLGNGECIIPICEDASAYSNCIDITSLSDKNIERLHLRVCLVGAIYRATCWPNLPMDFIITFPGIKQVYAFDCSLTVCDDFGNNKYSLLGVTNSSFVLELIPGMEVPIAFLRDQDIYQQCRYYREGEYEFRGCIFHEEIDGISIICENCYSNDYYLSFIDREGNKEYMQPEFISYFDPILE